MMCSAEHFVMGRVINCDRSATWMRKSDRKGACDEHQKLMSEVHRLAGRPLTGPHGDEWERV